VKDHIEASHSDKILSGTTFTLSNIRPSENSSIILHTSGRMFIQIVRVSEHACCTFVVALSSAKTASKFKYKFQINNENETEKLTFDNVVWSCGTGKSDIIESGKYVRVPFRILKKFVNHEGNLPYTLEIYKHLSHKKPDTVFNS
jgi:hypothetical protein